MAALTFDITPELRSDFRRWQRPAVVVGAAGLIASAAGAFFWPDQFFRSYLLGFLFWIGISLGSLGIDMLQYLTGGAWGVVTRRPLESAMRTLPLMLILFVPIVFGIPYLYSWSHSDLVAKDQILRDKHAYLNVPFFLVRAAAYFAIWLALAYFLNRWSAQQDRTSDPELRARCRRLSAGGLILYVFTITFASIDWAESLQPHFYSTMWGFLFVAQQGLTALSFITVVMVALSRRDPMREVITPTHLQDLGKLLLMFVLLWAYFGFSQFLIVWEGDLPHEIEYYLPRLGTSWGYLFAALTVLQFAIPFLLLLSRELKRHGGGLLIITGILLCIRPFDVLFVTTPDLLRNGFHVSWMDLTALLGIGGIWIAVYLRQLQLHPLLPLHDPGLQEALEHGRED